ncbi:MAG: hypothetical protein U1E02_29600, partial [Hydrogenophaga sp.]|nr:hypothetical protein [Hydrogenophaga sp.]
GVDIGSVDGMLQRPGWMSMRAMRAQRLCVFPADESDTLVRPGPRWSDRTAGSATPTDLTQCLQAGWTAPSPYPRWQRHRVDASVRQPTFATQQYPAPQAGAVAHCHFCWHAFC